MLAELHCKAMKCKNYIYMQYLAGGGSKFMILHKAKFFSYNKGINLFNYSQVVPIFEKVPMEVSRHEISYDPFEPGWRTEGKITRVLRDFPK